MKHLLLITFLFISFALFSVAPTYSDYIGTTWGMEEITDDEYEYLSVMIKIEFHESNATLTFKNCYKNKEEINPILQCKEQSISSDDIAIHKPHSSSGIHGNQYSIQGNKDGEPIIGFFIANEECILFPDTDAPEGCLKKF